VFLCGRILFGATNFFIPLRLDTFSYSAWRENNIVLFRPIV